MATVSRRVHSFAPATVANVSCGFDIFGFAVDALGDEVIACFDSSVEGATIVEITGDKNKLPRQSAKNTATVAGNALLKKLDCAQGIAIVLRKGMPLGSGLGSSAASAVAAVLAINELLGSPMKRKDLLPFVLEGERVACGSAHADNVAPSLLGGFLLIRSYNPLDIVEITTPKNLCCTIVHPAMEIPTEKARQVLRKEISLKEMTMQCGNVAGLTMGLMTSNFPLISRSLQDVVVEPQRSSLIVGYGEVIGAAKGAGALGAGISGAGPSLFALTDSMKCAEQVGEAMQKQWKSFNMASVVYCSSINHRGAYYWSE